MGDVIVRTAIQADEPEVYALLLALDEDNSLGFPRNDQRVWAHINACCRGQGGVCAVIDGPDGNILASVGVMAMPAGWYTDAWLLRELWFFVRPECRRGTGYANALMAWLKRHQREMSERLGYDIPCVTGPTSRKRLAAKERWWATHGQRIGAFFVVKG
jgi:hypothetical protein